MTFSFFRSDKLVYTNAWPRPISPCQPTQALAGPVFSYLGNPHHEFTSFTDASNKNWGAQMPRHGCSSSGQDDVRHDYIYGVKAMPHGSEKSPEKNCNEIRHSLCMPHGRIKIVANYEENDT